MPRKKILRSKIIGSWTTHGDNIIKYDLIPKDIKCSRCTDGKDESCPTCHGVNIEPVLKWYQYKKRLKKWLE